MKQIYTLLTATLMLAGTALWSGCSNNELLENEKPGTEKPDNQQAANFKFSLKGIGKTNTRAAGDGLTKEGEEKINTLYVAFFIKDGKGEEANYKLHRIFAYDASITFSQPGSAWQSNTEITKTAETEDYVIASPGTVGDYIAYFIANPDADMKTKFAEFQLSEDKESESKTHTKLSDFKTLTTKSGTADGMVEEGNEGSKAARGFIMLGKLELYLNADNTTLSNINMERLAARFDFINSAATETNSKVKITKITINKAAQVSNLVELADVTAKDLQAKEVTLWTNDKQTEYISAYTYENLNIGSSNDRLSITLEYELTKGSEVNATKMKKIIYLTVGESDLAVQRNHIYRIYMNGITGESSVEVQDWNEGATVTVPDKSLSIAYAANDLGKIGDYIYLTTAGELNFSDGGLRRAYLSGKLEWAKDQGQTMPGLVEGKGTCIGVVFSTRVSETDREKHGWTGYAMAPKIDVFAYLEWCSSALDNQGIPNVNTGKEMIDDMDGYSHCQAMENATDVSYPQYNQMKTNAASDLRQLPEGTSGWYMPSIGQLIDLYYNLAGMTSLRTTLQDVTFSQSQPGDQKSCGNGDFAFANTFFQNINKTDIVAVDAQIGSSSEADTDRYATVSGSNASGLILYIFYQRAVEYSSMGTYYVFAFTKPKPQP